MKESGSKNVYKFVNYSATVQVTCILILSLPFLLHLNYLQFSILLIYKIYTDVQYSLEHHDYAQDKMRVKITFPR